DYKVTGVQTCLFRSRSETSRAKRLSSSSTGSGRAAATDSRIVHPRVEEAVEQVHHQVRQDDRGREQQVERLDHRIVPVLDRLERSEERRVGAGGVGR